MRDRYPTCFFVLVLLCLVGGCGTPDRDATEPASPALVDPREVFERLASEGGAGPVVGREGWLFFRPELRHLSAERFWDEAAEEGPLAAILDFHAQLSERGIELIFMPVPAKAAVYPEMLPGGDQVSWPGRVDEQDLAFILELRQSGLTVIDLVATYRDIVVRGGAPLYCRQDTHWSPYGLQLAARKIAGTLADRPWMGDVSKLELQVEEARRAISGDLWRELDEPRPAQEEVELAFVRDAQSGESVAPSRDSPVLLLGDSHTLVFHAGGDLHAQGAGLVDHLARELGFAVDLLGVRGSGATASRVNLLRRAGGLEGKKVVVWCLSAREFTQGQEWKKVPVGRP